MKSYFFTVLEAGEFKAKLHSHTVLTREGGRKRGRDRER